MLTYATFENGNKGMRSGFKQCGLFVFFLFAVLTGGAARADQPALEIGVFPYLSTRTVLTTYQPLQQYLERHLQRPVLLVTAPDMRTFVERTQKGTYSYVITAPHFARYAQLDAEYVPILRVDRQLFGVVVVDQNSDMKRISDLRGRSVVIPDRLAIISMLGLELLRSSGLRPDRDVAVHSALSHNSAVLSVQRGDHAAAVTSITALRQMPDALRASVRELGRTQEVPHVMYLARKDMPKPEVERLTALILEFAERTPEGRRFIEDTGYVGLRRVSADELRKLDPYVEELRSLLSTRQ